MNTLILRNYDYTAQEVQYIGGSEYMDGAKTGKPWTPMRIALGENIPLHELNAKRAEQKFFFSRPARAFSGNQTTFMSLEPLNDRYETIQDPQAYVEDEATGEYVHSPEATAKLYAEFRRIEEEWRREEPGQPDWYYSAFIRESLPLREGVRGSEGMKNV